MRRSFYASSAANLLRLQEGRGKSVNEQTLERLEKVKHAFQGTPWSSALAHIAQPQDLVAMTFAPSGTIHAVRCRYIPRTPSTLRHRLFMC